MALPEESPSPDSRPSIGLVEELFQEARREKRKKIPAWNRQFRLTRNKTWSIHRDASLPSPSASEIFPALASLVAWMTDQSPRCFVSPSPDTMEFTRPPEVELVQRLTDDMQQIIDSWWILRKLKIQLELSLWDMFTFGCGIFKTGWDSSLDFGRGDAVGRRIDPYAILPDPNASSIDDCRYLLEVRKVPLFELKARFGARADRIAEGSYDNVDERPRVEEGGFQIDGSSLRSTGVTGDFPGTSTPGVPARYGKVAWSARDYTETVLLKECWVRNTRTEEIPVLEDGKITHKTWEIPYWEYLAEAGGVILNEDTANPFEHGELPYVRLPHIEEGEFWSVSMVEHLASGHIAMNRLLAAMQMSAELTGNPILLEPEGGETRRTKVMARPGGRWAYSPGVGKPEWMTPPQMSGDVMGLIQYWRDTGERTSGVGAVTRGASLRRREPAQAVDAAQEAAFVRIRAVLGNMEESLRQVTSQTAANVVQFYLEPRTVPKVGPDGADGYLQLGARHFWYPDATPDGVELVPLHFDTYLDASSLPLSRQARQAEMMTLHFAGLVPPEIVLDVADVPNKEKAIAWANKQAEAAAAAGMAPGKNPRRK